MAACHVSPLARCSREGEGEGGERGRGEGGVVGGGGSIVVMVIYGTLMTLPRNEMPGIITLPRNGRRDIMPHYLLSGILWICTTQT